MSASNDVRVVKVGNVSVGGGTLAVAAGPCVLDTFEEALAIAKTMKEYCAEFGFGYIFKASFDKANRTSIKSYRGPGIEKGLEWLSEIGREAGVPRRHGHSRAVAGRGGGEARRPASDTGLPLPPDGPARGGEPHRQAA